MKPRIPAIAVGAAVAAGVVTGMIRKRRRDSARRRVGTDSASRAEVETRHQAKVDRIVKALAAHDRAKPLSLRKSSPPHQVPKNGDLRRNDDKIDIGDLTEIITIDPERRICVAEAGVTFVDLVHATMKHGLVPIVVPELKTITIGGAVSGCSIESMSFVYGGFHDTCLEYEVITARGEVLTCTPEDQHALIFQMMHGAFGTLGILSKLTFRLVPAKSFVHLVYETHRDFASYRASIEAHAEKRDCDFMDGIIHSPQKYVLSVGHFVDTAPYTSSYEWLKVYYVSTGERREDYLTTPDYFFRYDRGVTNVRPKSFLGRLVFGKFISSTNVLAFAEKIHFLLERERPTVTLDVFVPMSRVEEFLAWYRAELGYYPLWAVPYKRVHDYPWLNENFYKDLEDTMFLDLAIYGMRQPDGKNVHKMIEDKLRELGGMKTLISHNYYTLDEFWQTWNRANYQAVKLQTDPDNLFRDLYTKTCRAAMGVA
ncbi:MAG: FAD-binding oxidoreductase [Kofleriaceae bacterium]